MYVSVYIFKTENSVNSGVTQKEQLGSGVKKGPQISIVAKKIVT